MAKLSTYVYVDGIGYGPDSDVPPAVAAQIGDHCWEDGKAPRAKASKDANDDGGSGDGNGGPKPPPMSGNGSSVGAWHDYAKALEVEVDANAKREDVVEAIKAAGHPVD